MKYLKSAKSVGKPTPADRYENSAVGVQNKFLGAPREYLTARGTSRRAFRTFAEFLH